MCMVGNIAAGLAGEYAAGRERNRESRVRVYFDVKALGRWLLPNTDSVPLGSCYTV
jgi:hypothetical protein